MVPLIPEVRMAPQLDIDLISNSILQNRKSNASREKANNWCHGLGIKRMDRTGRTIGMLVSRNWRSPFNGGGAGVMTSVSRAFAAVQNRKGQILGIIPGDFDGGKIVYKIGYPHPWVEIPIYTHLPLSGIEGKEPLSRNHINILSSDAIVALPGGAGTQSEIELAVHYGKPIICFTSSIDLNSSGIRSTDSLDEVKRFVVEVLKSLEKL